MTVTLDLLGHGPRRPDLLTDLLVTPGSLPEVAERWGAKLDDGPGVGPGSASDAMPTPAEVAETLEGGTCAYLDLPAWVGEDAPGSSRGGPAPTTDEVAALADIVITAAHSGVGFGVGLVPRCRTANQVWAVLGAAVGAMTGDDVRSALRQPDPARLRQLGHSAGEAVREVVTFCLVDAEELEVISAGVLNGR